MSVLLLSDTHFTDNPRDDYRWGLLPWVKKKAKELNINQVLLLGDVCDAKDRHSSVLVNKLVDQLTTLSKYCDIIILKGNHDHINEDLPYFLFIESFKTNIVFVSEVTSYWISFTNKTLSAHCLFLPSTRNWEQDWKNIDFNQYDMIFAHATFTGAKSETGIELNGISPSIFAKYKGKIYSGDIHVPQKVGRVEYVGSPYRVRFGDSFNPRLVYIDDDFKAHDLRFPTISKHVLVLRTLDEIESEVDKLGINKGDQVKIRMRLSRSEYASWSDLKSQIKQKAQDFGWELFGPELLPLDKESSSNLKTTAYKSSEEIVEEFIKQKKLSKQQAEIGLSLIRDP